MNIRHKYMVEFKRVEEDEAEWYGTDSYFYKAEAYLQIEHHKNYDARLRKLDNTFPVLEYRIKRLNYAPWYIELCNYILKQYRKKEDK